MLPNMKGITNEALQLMKDALANPLSAAQLAKDGITTGDNITYYDLRAPAFLHVPILTPVRDVLPRVQRTNSGTALHWKTIKAITGSGFDNAGWVPEGQRSGRLAMTAVDSFTTYVPIGEESSVTFEAEMASIGFDDAQALSKFALLKKLFLKEEIALLGGNKSIKLGQPTISGTAHPVTAGSTLAAATYYMGVVALTLEGFNNSSVTAGCATQKTVTGADGSTFTVNGGSSQGSALTAGVAVAAGEALQGTVTPIKGAVAYAWYVGQANNTASVYLQSITTVNTFTLSTPFVNTTQPLSSLAADYSYNDGTSTATAVSAFDGLLTSSLNASDAYFVDLLGASLTTTNAGSVAEIDDMLLSMFDTSRVGVSVLWVSAKTAKKLRDLVLTNGSAPLLRFNVDAGGQEINFAAGGTIGYYFSPISVYGGTKIPIKVHPNLPDGIIMGHAEELPAWYENNQTPAVAQVVTQRDYYSIDWPLKTRAREHGAYVNEALAVYAPFATGVLCNFAV